MESSASKNVALAGNEGAAERGIEIMFLNQAPGEEVAGWSSPDFT